MRKILLMLAFSLWIGVKAQVLKVDILASGLTCSMCSNAIHKSLNTLEFIDVVEANISDHTFRISFKEGYDVDFGRIRKKVEDAGFFVAKFTATIRFEKTFIQAGKVITIGRNTLRFINSQVQQLDGETTLQVLDKGFISPKDYKNMHLPKLKEGKGIYHVTI